VNPGCRSERFLSREKAFPCVKRNVNDLTNTEQKGHQMKKMKRMKQATMLALMLGSSALGHAADAGAKTAGSGLFDLSFAGGTPQKLVSEMEKAGGLKLNILIPPELADVRIQPMELRSVYAEDVLDSLTRLSPDSMRWIRSAVSAAGKSQVWVLARAPDNRKTQAFYVGHLLQKFKIDDITTAVQTTWQLGGKDARTELKYHQDTQLLIALGSPEQLGTAADVLAQLRLAIEPVRLSPEKTKDTKSADDKKGNSAAQP
jgi:hypothetical protein